MITDPPAVCAPDKTDITKTAITSGSEPGLSFGYWQDVLTTIRLALPNAIPENGIYFIKATNASGCYSVKPVIVKIGPKPGFTVENPPAVIYPSTVDLRQTIQSGAGYNFSFWRDPFATQSLLYPQAVDSSGVYYIRGSANSGCSIVLPVRVMINPAINAPNVFSPNNDGINDVWSIPSLQLYPGCVVEVFDRYGRNVFRSTGYPKEWDGKNADGNLLPSATYYYVIKLSTAIPPLGGSVTILR